jgi:uncharacterized protein YigE (DUF2233 family)
LPRFWKNTVRKTNAALLLAIVSIATARGEWAVTLSESERGTAGIEHRHATLADNASGERATIDLALFSTKSATLRVIDNPNGAALAAVMQRERCLAGVNGGYFDPENAPVGLLICDGEMIAPLRKAKLLSGLALVSKGQIQLLRFAEYSSRRNASAAVQCGPFLVERGQPVAGVDDIRSARRSFILRAGSNQAAVGFCSEVTLAQLGEILVTTGITNEIKVERALNLDGGSSSAFWFAAERGPFSISEQKTVRDFVAVVPK